MSFCNVADQLYSAESLLSALGADEHVSENMVEERFLVLTFHLTEVTQQECLHLK